MLTVLNIKRVVFGFFSTWQAGSVRNSFPNRRLHVGLPKPFFTLRVSCAFLQNADSVFRHILKNRKSPEPDIEKSTSDSGLIFSIF